MNSWTILRRHFLQNSKIFLTQYENWKYPVSQHQLNEPNSFRYCFGDR